MVLGNQDAAMSRNFYPRSESSQHDVNFHLQRHVNQDYWDQDQIYHASDLNTIDHGDDEHNNWSGQLIHNHDDHDHLPEDQLYHGSDLNTIDHGDDDHKNWSGQLQ